MELLNWYHNTQCSNSDFFLPMVQQVSSALLKRVRPGDELPVILIHKYSQFSNAHLSHRFQSIYECLNTEQLILSLEYFS